MVFPNETRLVKLNLRTVYCVFRLDKNSLLFHRKKFYILEIVVKQQDQSQQVN